MKQETAGNSELLGIKEELKAQISAGKIVFDNGSTVLKDQLLNKVSTKLQNLVLFLSKEVATVIRISDLIRTTGDSHHTDGRAVDIGNEAVASQLLPIAAKQSNVTKFEIDEIIFDAAVSGETNRNKWNYDQGSPHNYNPTTLDAHKNHIHLSVKA